MQNRLRWQWLFSLVFIAQVYGPVWADHLAVPGPGRVSLVDLETLRVSQVLDVGGKGQVSLAVHPSAPVLATAGTEGAVIFWNVPSFEEASRFQEPLLDGVTSLAFSADGARLFCLSPPLRSLVVYDLRSSRVETLWPIPGSDPTGLWTDSNTVVVWQKDGCSVLDPSSGGLLLQVRLGGLLAAGECDGKSLHLSSDRHPGIARYSLRSGQAEGPRYGDAVYQALLHSSDGRVLAVSQGASPRLEAWSKDSARPVWSEQLSGESEYLEESRDGRWLYLSSRKANRIIVLDASSGRELGRLALDDLEGPPVRIRTSD